MPDFREYVRRHLPPIGVSGSQLSDVVEELALELEEHYERAIRDGLEPDEAWRSVRQRIQWTRIGGDLRSIFSVEPESGKQPRKESMLASLFKDFQYGLRLLAKNPGFTATAVLTIALGIGPNTAIFSLLYAVFWAPSENPYYERNSVLWSRHGEEQGFGVRGGIHVSPREYFEWKKQSASFEFFSAVVQSNVTLNDDAGYPERIQIQALTPGHIPFNGGQLLLGRDFLPEEGVEGRQHVVVLSNRFWRNRYNSEPNIIGKQLRLNGIPHTIVGVLAPGWWDNRREPLWPALAIPPDRNLDQHHLTVLAVRKPGVTIEQAQAEMNAIAARLAEKYPDKQAGWTVRVDRSRNSWLNERTRTNLWLLMAAVSLVLLIACLNVANLLLARGASRVREVAVRVSLGATKGQIFRQLLTESLTLSMLGGVIGIGLSFALLKIFLTLAPPFLFPPAVDIRLSRDVLLFTVVTTLLAGLVFGCAPAWQIVRQSVAEALKRGGRAGLGHGRHRLGKVLVVAEFALALSLLAGAGLAMRSYWNRTHADFGVRTDHILAFELHPTGGRFTSRDQINQYNRVLIEKLEAVPQVLRVTAVHGLPLASSGSVPAAPASRLPAGRPEQYPRAGVRVVSPGFFEVFGVRILQGRVFNDQDRSNTVLVAMVNETFRKQYLSGLEPLREELVVHDGRASLRLHIVAVYQDIQNGEQFGGPPRPEFIVPITQVMTPFVGFAVRTSGDPARVTRSIAAAVHEIDASMPMANVRTMEQVVHEQTAFDRFEAALYGGFAALALLLATVGIYGLMAFVVSQRTPEMGLRMALGADRRSIVRLILKDGCKLAVAGLVFGAVGAWYAGRLLQTSLYGTAPVDPLAFGAVAAILLGAGLVACLLPARKAASVDPLHSLRAE